LLLAVFKFAPGAGVCQLEGMVPGMFVVKEENIFHEKAFQLRIKKIGKGGYGKVSKQPVVIGKICMNEFAGRP
jgi:hypothetical protein